MPRHHVREDRGKTAQGCGKEGVREEVERRKYQESRDEEDSSASSKVPQKASGFAKCSFDGNQKRLVVTALSAEKWTSATVGGTMGWMMHEPDFPPLTEDQLEVMRRFALFEIGLEEMKRSLAGVFEFNFEPKEQAAGGITERRTATGNFPIPEPGIVITREHISNALERKRFDLISERDLVAWATVLLLNDAYVWDPADEDLIAEWLNDISLTLGAG